MYLNEVAAADLLGVSPKTLSRWRWAGKGPDYYKFGGAVRYKTDDLEAFAEDSRQEVASA
uniref:helix-turn-helix domain-containing protein n=1 Tax=Altererythrobacter segetis TaxID=1104773 RepID=UPI0014087307|nr:helix-turn-helix domain-containing protein [Altererythrobacter segetis]